MKRNLVFVVTLLLASGVALAQDEATPKEIIGADDLVKQKSSQWGGVWIHPDADISKFSKL